MDLSNYSFKAIITLDRIYHNMNMFNRSLRERGYEEVEDGKFYSPGVIKKVILAILIIKKEIVHPLWRSSWKRVAGVAYPMMIDKDGNKQRGSSALKVWFKRSRLMKEIAGDEPNIAFYFRGTPDLLLFEEYFNSNEIRYTLDLDRDVLTVNKSVLTDKEWDVASLPYTSAEAQKENMDSEGTASLDDVINKAKNN